MAMISVVMMVVGVIVWAFDDETGAGDSAAHSALGLKDNFLRQVKGLDGALERGQRNP
jgi:hypothetical protein